MSLLNEDEQPDRGPGGETSEEIGPVGGPGGETSDGGENTRNLCSVCNFREVDFNESSSSSLCARCRRQQIELIIPAGIKVFLTVTLVIFIFSLIRFVPVLSNYRDYLSAEKQMRSREYYFALLNYYSLLEEYDYSTALAMKTADAAMSAQNIGYLAGTLELFLFDKYLNDSDYAKFMAYCDYLDDYFDTWYLIEDIFTEMNDVFGDSDDYDTMKEYVHSQLIDLLYRGDVDYTYLYFLLAETAPDIETMIKYLRLSTEWDSRCTYTYSYYGTALRRNGELDLARQVYEKALELNACDELSWRGLGVLQLLEGEMSAGLEKIRYAFDIDPYGLYVANSLIIALCENGLSEEAMAVYDWYTSENFEITEDLQEYLDGKIDLWQYYMG